MKDTELKSIIKAGMRQDAGNPYFVRKVMNRLPAKRGSIGYAWVMWLACGMGAVILGLLWADYISSFAKAGLQPVYFFSLWSATLFLLLTLLRPLLSSR